MIDKISLIKRFNNREPKAFGEVYELLHTELNRYAAAIFYCFDENTEDFVHDIFIKLWQDNDVVFDSIDKVKAFVFISLKNSLKNYCKHRNYIEKYRHLILDESQVLDYDVVENEIYTEIGMALNILPSECAKVMKLYMDGYSFDEISHLLNIKIQTVYNYKNKAITILKKALNPDKYLLLSILITPLS